MRAFVLLALPLALAACSQQPETDGDAPESAETAAARENVTLDLQATGIVVPPQEGIEQLDVPFGSNRSATEATLANVLGAATGGHEGEGDCALQTTEYPGLTLIFQEEQFVGYMASAPYVPELGRAEMLGDPGVSLVADSTLDGEFAIGTGETTIAGKFSGEDDTAQVERLWAGENCIFR
ncbi:hypothetical protein CP97_07845 [Aurantiacibacter atlanticus]|uniref:Uncharacterized protein n=1 Tax=Aurantiacibacter atlanticus TaxID=1648404 RepID=A0A0H4VXU1_9SPHN|nr:hypothetical protein [Aurantiacibacter atlanticus]AKQ41958.1 hypothetical protein CP97_07845 [Aurantiacibacter atlanticus]MDF1835178.1 hypothetical protein [Alteraurantiacibacter sp. bin_em_oilr2.035]